MALIARLVNSSRLRDIIGEKQSDDRTLTDAELLALTGLPIGWDTRMALSIGCCC